MRTLFYALRRYTKPIIDSLDRPPRDEDKVLKKEIERI